MSALLVALALQAAAPNWEPAGRGRGFAASFDTANIVIVDSNRRRVRLRAVFDQVAADGGASGIALVELHCPNHSSTLIETQLLDANGNVIGAQVVPPEARRAIRNPAEGPDRVVHARVCGSRAQ